MASDRRIDGTLLLFHHTVYNAAVAPVHGMFLDLLRNKDMALIIFADNQWTRCVHIDAVYDARADLPVDAGQTVPAVIHDGIDKRAGIMPGGRVDDHSLRLVDD